MTNTESTIAELNSIARDNGYSSVREACRAVIDDAYPASDAAEREFMAGLLLQVMIDEDYTSPYAALTNYGI